jgi:hypothetical protein
VKRLVLAMVLALTLPSGLVAQREPGEGEGPRRPFYEDTGGPQARRAYGFGIVGYSGGQWQPSGVEVTLLWPLIRRTRTAVGGWVALGSFVQDQAVLIGRTQGFFAALGATVRQPLATLADIGSERNRASIRLEMAADLGWAADFDSPLPQGKWDARAALLAGVAFGSEDPMGQNFAVLFGPAVLMGRVSTTHGEFVLRFSAPIR